MSVFLKSCGLVILFSTSVFATGLPCLEIRKACEAAGYLKGKSQQEKNLVDCVKAVREGQTPSGVQISADVVKACKEQ